MDSAAMMKLVGELLLIFLVSVFLIYPLILSGANRLINGFWAPYWRTLGTVVLTGIVAGIVGFIVGAAAGKDHLWAIRIASIIATAVVGGGIMKGFVHHKDGEPLPYSRTALASLVLGIVVVLIGLGLSPLQKSAMKQVKAFKAQAVANQTAATSATTATAASTAVATSAPAAASAASVSAATSQTSTPVAASTAATPESAASTH